MSSNVRSFFRSDRSRSKPINLKKTRIQRLTSKSPTTKDHLDWILNINSLNSSCCGGDEKKNQSDASRMIKETIGHTKAIADPMEASDHKIEQIVQQNAPKVEIDDDLKDLFGNKEITKAMINQLAQRALTGPMNSNNDNPPRLCTKKHCSFANEPLTIKPVTCVPGIGPVHGNLCEKQGIIMAHQLLSRYMMSANDEEFEQSLVSQLGFTPKSAAMTLDGLKEMQRHLI